MNAWGTKVFEDDAYLDWFDTFCIEHSPIEHIRAALTEIVNNDGFMDFDTCVAALAAAEVIAAAIERPGDEFPVGDYFTPDDDGKPAVPKPELGKIRKKISPALLAKAYDVVEKIQNSDDSALRQVWEETDQLDDWLDDMEELKLRLTPEDEEED